MWHLRDGDGRIAPGWCLFPLRLFLGVTFLFAGLQKLANPQYFHDTSPISFHAQLLGTAHTSPIGGLLGHLAGSATAIGLLIAVGEVAVGVGALLGLLTRVAAVGGALLALSLFLAVSFRTSPYYTGADIVFLFAWTPFVLAGAAGAPALDTWMARSTAATAVDTGERDDAISRGAVIALVAGAAAMFAGAVAGVGRVLAPAGSGTTVASLPGPGATTATSAPSATSGPGGTTTTVPQGTSIGPASDVPVGGSAAFTDPSTGDPSLVIQHTSGTFVAFDAICPHAGCTVAYQQQSNIIACPCHGSEFNPRTGAVVQGPATSGLTPIKVITGANGDLYVV
jgi:thiosulfate dehydrogenase [quinone] large subunit